MKTKSDPRHVRREQAVKALFAESFHPQASPPHIQAIIPHLPEIDALIEKSAPDWPLPKIAKIDLAVLRLAVYELAVEKIEPPKVIIDEAVELAKEFGNEHSPQFINGVLGTIFQWTNKPSGN